MLDATLESLDELRKVASLVIYICPGIMVADKNVGSTVFPSVVYGYVSPPAAPTLHRQLRSPRLVVIMKIEGERHSQRPMPDCLLKVSHCVCEGRVCTSYLFL